MGDYVRKNLQFLRNSARSRDVMSGEGGAFTVCHWTVVVNIHEDVQAGTWAGGTTCRLYCHREYRVNLVFVKQNLFRSIVGDGDRVLSLFG